MKRSLKEVLPRPRGQILACEVLHGKIWVPRSPWRHNKVMYDWATIVASLLLGQGDNYQIGGMYLEFENVADPDDVVDPPDFGRDGGIVYYNSLADSDARDYLRVPLVGRTLESTDTVNFPGGNRAIFFAASNSDTGVHGTPFSDAYNSKLIGGALVAFVDPDDATRDLVLSRAYLDVEDQVSKLPTSEVGLIWRQRLD